MIVTAGLTTHIPSHKIQPQNELLIFENFHYFCILNFIKDEKAKTSLKNTELLKSFKNVDCFLIKKQNMLFHFN